MGPMTRVATYAVNVPLCKAAVGASGLGIPPALAGLHHIRIEIPKYQCCYIYFYQK